MNVKNVFLVLLAVFFLNGITAQNKTKISGSISDFNNKPIAGAIIYVDSVKTQVTTNKKGQYKIKIPSTAKHIGTFTEAYGLLSTSYTGEKIIDFVYRDPKDIASGDDMKIGVAYKKDKVKNKGNSLKGTNYGDFSSVTQLLNARFPFVRARGGELKVGKGPNTLGGDKNPLILIDDMRSNVALFLTLAPTDIEHIRVVRQGSEAAEYGSLGASNGVIIVKLKNNK